MCSDIRVTVSTTQGLEGEEGFQLPAGMEWALLGILLLLIIIAILIAACLVCKQQKYRPLSAFLAPKTDVTFDIEEEGEASVHLPDPQSLSEDGSSTLTGKPVHAVRPLKASEEDSTDTDLGDNPQNPEASPTVSSGPRPAPRRIRLSICPSQDSEDKDVDRRERIRKSVYSIFRHSLAELDAVQTYLVDRLEFGQLTEDFKDIPVCISSLPRDDSVLPENKKKNRFASVLPYDKNRVVLSDGYCEEEATDYVNASYIDGYWTEKAYIAAQGPKDITTGDFWRMVWQEKITDIVMLTNLKERGRDKCHQYWPEKQGQAESYGPVTVATNTVESRATFTVRRFTVILASSPSGESESRGVTQYHYVAWPDFGVPLTASLVSFWRYVTRMREEQGGAQECPLLVHCSAGVGRSGTFIALDLAMQQSVEEQEVDLLKLVTSLRHQRCLMVQAASQFEFLHTALLEAYTSRDSVIPVDDMSATLTSPVQALQPNARIDREFRLLMEMKALTNDTSTKIARQEGNRDKNRDPKCLPADDHIAYLSEPVQDRGDYINAVYMPTFHELCGSLVTQLPLPSTLVDFWRLVYGNRVTTIVSLSSPDEQQNIHPPCQYWPREEGEGMEVPPYTLHLHSTSPVSHSLLSYTLSLLKEGVAEAREVKLLHYQGWEGEIGGDVDDVLNIIDTLMAIPATQTFLVQCADGVRKSGLFCALCDVINRMTYDQEVDVYMSVRHIQSVSPQAVSRMVQYRYLYEVAQRRSEQLSVYANDSVLHSVRRMSCD